MPQALFLFVKSASCACRCVHCSFDPAAAFDPLPPHRTLSLIRPFVALRDSGTAPFAALAALPGDCPLNDPALPEVVAYLREHDVEGWRSLAVNGIADRHADLAVLRDAAGEVGRLDEDARPEGEWCAVLAGSAEAPHAADPAVIHLALWGDGGVTMGHDGDPFARLPDDSAAAVLEGWADRYAALEARYPTVGELAERHGDPDGRRLHDRLSIVRKWCAIDDGAQ